jgi:hypothetical protein
VNTPLRSINLAVPGATANEHSAPTQVRPRVIEKWPFGDVAQVIEETVASYETNVRSFLAARWPNRNKQAFSGLSAIVIENQL